MKEKLGKKSVIVLVVLLLAVIATGTYAWLSYRSNDTAMVLTIGDIDSIRITLSPYQITTTASPVSTYTNEPYSSITAANAASTAKTFNLFYKINTIADELKISSFKYTVTKSTNGTSYSSYLTGNFSTASNGNDLNIKTSESIPAGTTYYYRVYIWLDSSGGNQASASGKTLDCELRASIN
jgi:hypothetical protein